MRSGSATLNITFTTTLTSEDENRIAPALLKTLASILDLLPVAYRIRIDTADARTYQVTGPLDPKNDPRPVEARIKLVPRDPLP
jgi:hypothetical protein